ncbi:hypothetical protein AVEN_58382-1 [Araneus ventricosus]|uniref:Uncharacterized protein n=1 Tax=Araneus ventricosus TaxID=182803 RepID=A0A4Y2TQE2_ARAVE|nr:hypothetical protein AVEN_58382-1 [Araneus ventricosus]
MSQIAILVCNNLALQTCSKFDTERVQALNTLITTRQTCHKLAVSKSFQIIVETEYEDSLRLEPPTTHFIDRRLSHSARGTLLEEDRLR